MDSLWNFPKTYQRDCTKLTDQSKFSKGGREIWFVGANPLPLIPLPPAKKPNQSLRSGRIGSMEQRRRDLEEIRGAQLETWLERRGRFPSSRWRISEKRELREWFDQMDEDGSGEIDLDELVEPLLSSGLAQTIAEVQIIINSVDNDGSGSIGFDEFLEMMRHRALPPSNKRSVKTVSLPRIDYGMKSSEMKTNPGKKPLTKMRNGYASRSNSKIYVNPIIELQKFHKQSELELSSVLGFKRRKLLLDATMGESERRERIMDIRNRIRTESKITDGSYRSFSGFRNRGEMTRLSKHIDTERSENTNFVSIMRKMLDRKLPNHGETSKDQK